jgi:hypothetical protein
MSRSGTKSKPDLKPKIDSVLNTPTLEQNAISGSPLRPSNGATAEVWQCPHFKRQETSTHRRSFLVFVVIFLVFGILAAIAGIGVTFAATGKLKAKMLDGKWNEAPIVIAFFDFVSSIWIGVGSLVLGVVIFLFR